MLRMLKQLHRGEKGITGLETAIILIAFVVVAAVFAYTVLSAGIFSTQKSQQTIFAGLEQASGSLQMKGGVIAHDTDADENVDSISFVVSTAAAGGSIDLTEPTDTTPADGVPDTGSDHKMVVTYMDKDQRLNDVTWTKTELGYGDGDDVLDPGEQMEITVDLTAVDGGANPLQKNVEFTLEIKPGEGSSLIISRLMPHVDPITDLR